MLPAASQQQQQRLLLQLGGSYGGDAGTALVAVAAAVGERKLACDADNSPSAAARAAASSMKFMPNLDIRRLGSVALWGPKRRVGDG